MRCLPDGDLAEWRGRAWTRVPRSDEPVRPGNRADLNARFAVESYGGGICVALDVDDDVHEPATSEGALDDSDALDLALWPRSSGAPAAKRGQPLIGVHLRVGTLRQLVRLRVSRPDGRAELISANGVERPGGYRLELRLPLAVLTPLDGPTVDRLRLQIDVRDRDATGPARNKAHWQGTLELDPPLRVPEAVQERVSVRACMAAEPTALWGYHNGWRCSVPYRVAAWSGDDSRPRPAWRLSHARMPEPPRLAYLRERVVLLNFPGIKRGLAALFDRKETILSLLDLGVVGARRPGSASTRESDARGLRLPDGTWAVAVTHAYAARDVPPERGGRCNPGYLVLGSIIAVRGAPHVTPQEHVPEPKTPPRLEEVFRTVLDDCDEARRFDWDIAEDGRRVTVRDSLSPLRPAAVFAYDRGWFRRQGHSG